MTPREIVIEYVDECFWDECEKEIKKLINEALEGVWNEINAQIKECGLPGNGLDKTSERYGLLLALSIIAKKIQMHPDGFATTEELAKALGSSDEEAKRIQTRVEYLAGNKPSEYDELKK